MSLNAPVPISASTRYCAVLGHPIKHSASPAMQNAGLEALGLPWRYLAFDVPPSDLGVAVAGAKALRFIGLNLTVPHKLAALGLVEVLDESAKAAGAVNTIRFEARDAGGVWQPLRQCDELREAEFRGVGFNTDAEAIGRVLKEDMGLRLRGASVLLLGAGGAGRTAARQLGREGVGALWLVNRTASRAEVLADEIRVVYPDVAVRTGHPPGRVDVLINATSLGLRSEDPLPMDEARFRVEQAGAVFDMVYRPAETPLLRAARAAKCRAANGLGMLLYQGARALELWSGRAAPIDEMRRALEHEVYGT